MIFDTTSVGGRWRCCRLALTILTLFVLFCARQASAQTGIVLTIDKTHDAPTPVPSGQVFTYTIAYSWSGGAPGTLVITDAIPASLQVISAAPGPPVSSIVGQNVTFTLTGLTGTSGGGTVQINVKFRPGVTCDGTRACNIAYIEIPKVHRVASKESCVTASASNKWTFQKTHIAGCEPDGIVTWRICVINPAGGDIGGLNLVNLQITDLLPPGSVIVGVSGTLFSGWTGSPPTIGMTGVPVTLPVTAGPSWYCGYIQVRYPSPTFVVGQVVNNTASFRYQIACSQEWFTATSTASVTLCPTVNLGQLSKWLSINFYLPNNPYYTPVFAPGCCGIYNLYYRNAGTVAQPGFVMEDILPGQVDVSNIYTQVPAANMPVTMQVFCASGGVCSAVPCTTVVYTTAGTHTFNTALLTDPVCRVRWSYSGTILPGQTIFNRMDVCVRTNSFLAPYAAVVAGQAITNRLCASATNLAQICVTQTKNVDPIAPKILAAKFFVGKSGSCVMPSCTPNTAGPFYPGDIVRWRMVVTNVGSQTAMPCTITDILPTGLSYVGNPTYYYGPIVWAAANNPTCCALSPAVPSAIGGSITGPAFGATNLVWNFAQLPHNCDGSVDYLVIEFDVKINDNPTAPPGQYFNKFTFSAGNLTTPVTSNPAQLTVNGYAQFQMFKDVRENIPGTTFAQHTTMPPGSQAQYRLRIVNTGNLTLTNLCLLDILPHIGDISVLPNPGYTPRGSQFDMPMTGAGVSPAPPYVINYNSAPLASTKNPQRSSVCSGFCGVGDPVGAVPGTWTLGAPPSTYSFTIAGGITNMAPASTLDFFFVATVPPGTAAGLTACNTYGLRLNPFGMPATCFKVESAKSCVTVEDPPPSCDSLWYDHSIGECCEYFVTISNSAGALSSLQYNVLGGSGVVQNVLTNPCTPTSTIPGSLAGTTTGILFFNTGCTAGSPTNVQIDATAATASGKICIELIATIVTPDSTFFKCIDTICFDCDEVPTTRCDTMTVKPFPYPNLDLSGRTFLIQNLKSPASPICSVKIDVSPYPGGPGLTGGGLYVDGVAQSWPYGSSNGYTEITTAHGLPANSTVQFNLGIDYTIGWSGTVTVTVYHCDGDSCEMKYGPWDATKGGDVDIATPADPKTIGTPKIHGLTFTRDAEIAGKVRSIAIRHSSPITSIVAVSGGSYPCGRTDGCDDLIDVVRVNDLTVMVELRRPLSEAGADPTVVIAYKDNESGEEVSVEIVYYDANGQEIGTERVTISQRGEMVSSVGGGGGVTGIAGLLNSLTARPNPTTGRCDIGFTLPSAATVDLEIVDSFGETVATLLTGKSLASGDHRHAADLRGLPSGSYLVALRINGVPTVMRLELVK